MLEATALSGASWFGESSRLCMVMGFVFAVHAFCFHQSYQ